jgi:hypothetical protein
MILKQCDSWRHEDFKETAYYNMTNGDGNSDLRTVVNSLLNDSLIEM